MKFTLILLAACLAVRPARAAYQLRWTNLNLSSGPETSVSGQTLDTSGQPATNEYDSAGFQLKTGFASATTLTPFSFTISDLSIDFDSLSPGVFASLTNSLTVSSGGAEGYTVKAIADKPLTNNAGTATLADTTCDDNACSETTAGIWNSTAKFGFGYNMSGNDIPVTFAGPAYFKQFSNASLSETAQTVMSSATAADGRTATITYKINLPADQAGGDYENEITFIAAPSY